MRRNIIRSLFSKLKSSLAQPIDYGVCPHPGSISVNEVVSTLTTNRPTTNARHRERHLARQHFPRTWITWNFIQDICFGKVHLQRSVGGVNWME